MPTSTKLMKRSVKKNYIKKSSSKKRRKNFA